MTEPTWQKAHRKAQGVREARAAVCKAMKRGKMDLEEALTHPCVGKMPIIKLLSQLPWMGPKKAAFVCQCAHVEPYRPIELLSVRDRKALVDREGLAEARRERRNEQLRERRRRAKVRRAKDLNKASEKGSLNHV